MMSKLSRTVVRSATFVAPSGVFDADAFTKSANNRSNCQQTEVTRQSRVLSLRLGCHASVCGFQTLVES